MLNKNQIIKNSFYLYLASGVNIFFPIILIPILIERITLEGYGVLLLLQTIMNYANTFVDFGYNLIGVQKISVNSLSNNGTILGEALLSKIILIILSLIVIPITFFLFPIFENNWVLIFFGWLNVLGYAFYPIWYFQGIEKMEYISIFNLISKSLVFLLIYLLVNDYQDLDLAVLLLSSSFLINSVISWVFILSKEHIILPTILSIKKFYKEGLHIFISNVIVQFYSNGVLLLASNILLPESLAVLGVFLKIRDVLVSIIGPIQQAVFPSFSKLAALNLKTEIKNLINKIILLLLGVVFVFFLSLIVFKSLINKYLFSGADIMKLNSYLSLFFLFIVLPFGGVYTKVLVGFNKLKWVKSTTVWSSLLTIFISYPLIIYYDLYGALLVITLSYFLNSLLGYRYIKKIL